MKHLCLVLIAALSLSPSVVVAQEDCMQRAYDFLVQGHGISENPELKDIRQLGKVVNEEHQVLQGNEIRTIHFQGMTVVLFMVKTESGAKIFLTDVLFSKPNWAAKYDMKVGTPREQVELALCKASHFGQPDNANYWSYADGLAEVKISFNQQNKISSINWHYDLD